MASIQDLRERRAALLAKAKKIIENNPGAAWNTARQREYDAMIAEVEKVDREAAAMQRGAETGFRNAGNPANESGWVDQATGKPIAIARNGENFRNVLADAFPGAHDNEQIGLADFLRGVAGMKTDPRIRAALSEGTDSAGGFGLPAYTQLNVLEALAPVSSLLRAGAGVAMLDTGAKSYRAARVSTIPTAAWRSESGAVATSDPVFAAMDIVPRSLAFQFKVSRELLADAPNLDAALQTVIAQAFAKEMDRVGLRGSGTAPEPRGILNTSGIQSVPNTPNGSSLATDGYSDIIAAMTAILAADGPAPTAAIMSPRSYGVLVGLLETTNSARRVPPVLDQWKFIATSQIPNNLVVGTSGALCSEIYVADFRNLVFFMREGVSIQLVKELYAGTGEYGFIAHARVDCGVLYPAAFGVITGVLA